jgi:hypothetical protein
MGAFISKRKNGQMQYSEFFKGYFRESRIWDAELTESDIQNWITKEVQSSHSKISGMKAYYPMISDLEDRSKDVGGHDEAYRVQLQGNFSRFETCYPPLPFKTHTAGDLLHESTWRPEQRIPFQPYFDVWIDNQNTLSDDFQAGSVYVSEGRQLVVESGSSLILSGGLKVEGELFLQHTGSVYQSDETLVNDITGVVTFEIPVHPDKNQFRIAGVPFESLQTNQFPNSFEAYDPISQTYYRPETITSGEAVFVKGVETGMLELQGQSLVNGSLAVEVKDTPGTNEDWNMISNPYPSAISAQSFIVWNAWFNQNVSGTLYYWDDDMSGGGNLSTGDYATQTFFGGTASSDSDGGAGNIPNGYISPGQGFWIDAVGSGSVLFSNDMRVHGQDLQYFKTDTSQFERLWINARTSKGDYNQILVGFSPDADEGYDETLDGYKLSGNTDFSMSTMMDSLEMAIQVRSTPGYFEKVQFPLSLVTAYDGVVELSLATKSNWSEEYKVRLIDTWSGEEFNILSDKIEVNLVATSDDDQRFIIEIERIVGQDVGSNPLDPGLGDQTGMDDINTGFDVMLYPNPATDVLNVKLEELSQSTVASLTVMSISGHVMNQRVVQLGVGKIEQIDVYDLDPGIYILSIDAEGQRTTEMFSRQ